MSFDTITDVQSRRIHGYPLVFRVLTGVSVSGRVLSPANEPVEEASIAMEKASSFYELSNHEDTVKSDKNGQWIMEGVAPGRYRFRATHPTLPDAFTASVDVRSGDLSGLEIRFDAASQLAGRVSYRNEKTPSSGSVVAWYEVGQYMSGETRTAKLNPDGTFLLTGLHPGSVALQASTPVGPSELVEADVGAGSNSTVGLIVDEDYGLNGRLLFPDATPANEIPIEVNVLSGMDGDPLSIRLRKRDFTRTDRDGRFRATGLVPGVYSVDARVQQSGVIWRAHQTIVGDHGGKEQGVALLPSAQVIGRAVTGKGTPLLSLAATVDGDPTPVIVRAGDFEIKGIVAGHHELVLSANGYAPIALDRLNLSSGEAMNVGEVRLMPARTVCGRVVSTNESLPVQGARVFGGAMLVGDGTEPVVPEAMRLGSTSQALSDPQGGFCLRRMSDGTLTIIAQGSDGRTGSISVPAGPRAAEIAVPVDLPGVIRGKVISSSLRLAGLDVVAVRETVEGQRRMVKLGPDGQFEFEHLPAGVYTVAVMLDRAAVTYQMHARRVEVSRGMTASVEIRLGTGALALRVASGCDEIDDWPSQVYVVSGEVSAKTVGDLDFEVWSGQHPLFGIAFSYRTVPAWVPSMPPGNYSICAARAAPAAEVAMAGTAASTRPVSCLPLTITKRQGIQNVQVPCS